MKSQFAKTAALAVLAAGGASSAASATEGWYGRVDGGYSFEGSIEVEVEGVGSADLADLEDDWMASGGIGYAFPEGFRIEGELGYRQNDLDLIGQAPIDVEGEAKVLSGLANAFYDFNRGGTFQPYVGVGAGYGQLEIEDFDEGGFAWQAMAGVGIALSEQATLDIGYRYFNMPEVDVGEIDFGEGEVAEINAEYTHQAATVGLRWQFAAAPPPPAPVVEPPPAPLPPPPPPVVAAACPTTDFVVYFEWDRSNLNEAALETIDSAVRQAQACNLDAVVVVGHTDTSGSTEYNSGLSERRAAVVRDALAARGVPSNVTRTEAHGETDLARATRDGVREPLNRRTAVTITFRT